MNDQERAEKNEKLDKLIEAHSPGAYASIRENGRVQLDGYFTVELMIDVMKIIAPNARLKDSK